MLLLAAFGAPAQVSSIAPRAGLSFDGLVGPHGAFFTEYTEGPFTARATSGFWYQSLIYGNVTPSIFLGPINMPDPGAILITSSSGPFAFSAFDFSSNTGSTDYEIRGFLGNNLLLHQTGTFPNAFGAFDSLFSDNQNLALDALVINLFPGEGTTSVNLDNFGLVIVPEPATGALLALGALLLAFRKRT